MRYTHTGQEGEANEGLIAKVVPATLTGGFYAYVVTNGSHRYISGPHANREHAERDANDWIKSELQARGRARREKLERLKLHAGEHPAFTDEMAREFARELAKVPPVAGMDFVVVVGAQPVAELECPPTEDAPVDGTAVRS